MKRLFTFLIIYLVSGFSAFAQVGINEDNTPPDPSAMLDVRSDDKGV